MTYDELRDYIDKFDAAGMVNEPVVKALRAVVELHSPPETKDGVTRWIANDCAACTHSNPCPTIKAIEKELE